MQDKCVFCGSDEINTQMTISLDDGSKVQVGICEEHAEEATVKSVRTAYLAKKQEIDDIIAKARELGIEFTDPGPGKLITATKIPQPQAVQQETLPTGEELEEGDDVVSTSVVDNHKGMVSVGGQTEMGSVESVRSIDVNSLTDKLPEEARRGKAKMAIVEAREGQPIVVQQHRTDGTGTTRINVSKKENDATLQRRFKNMANQSMQEDGPTPDFARQGYQNSTTTCPLCRGDCVINNGGQKIDCPKCDGAGVISIY